MRGAAVLIAVALLALVPAAQARVLVVAADDPRATLIDLRSNDVRARPGMPGRTRAVTVTADGARAFLAAGKRIVTLDLASFAKTAQSAPLAAEIQALAVTPDATAVWAAVGTGLLRYDPATLAIGPRIALAGRPTAIAIAPDGTRAVVLLRGDRIAVVDLMTQTVAYRLRLHGVAGVAFSPTGTPWLSATKPARKHRPEPGRLVPINISSATFGRSLTLGSTTGGGGIAVAPSGTRAFVGGDARRGRRGALVDLGRLRVVRRVRTGAGPSQPAFTPDDVRIYVANAGDHSVAVHSAFTGARLRTLRGLGRRPLALAAQPGLALVIGTEAADALTGTRGADRLEGLGGDDVLRGGRGDDQLIGGLGNDTLSGSEGNDYIEGGDGDDRATGDQDNDQIVLGAGDDSANGGSSNDVLDGGPGNDTLDGGDADDTITGGEGDDTIIERGLGNDPLLDGGPGDDYIDGGRGSDRSILGGEGADILRGGNGSESIDGGSGDDMLDGGLSGDRMYGRAGDDALTGDAGRDSLSGSDGNDKVDGGSGDDTLYGGNGADEVIGGPGVDYISGGAGSDVIRAADDSADRVNCGSGRDTVYVESTDPSRDALISCETVIQVAPEPANEPPPPSIIRGGPADDTLYGTDGDDSVFGQDGDDELFGNGGDDYVDGEDGNDTLHAGPGADRVFGRHGNDVILGNEDDDYIEGGYGADVVDGGPGNDTIYGNQEADRVAGGDGDDRINLLDGVADAVDCGEGFDTVFADPGDDVGSSCEDVRR